MEAHAAAAVATVGLTGNSVFSLMKMIRARYSVKTSEGKPAFPHPYRPWEVPEGTPEAGAEKAYLAYKAFENSKEWLQLILPLVWVLSLSGEAVPYVTQTGVQLLTLGLAGGYAIGDRLYFSGYSETAPKRIRGFFIRTLFCQGFLVASAVSAACLGLRAMGVALPA